LKFEKEIEITLPTFIKDVKERKFKIRNQSDVYRYIEMAKEALPEQNFSDIYLMLEIPDSNICPIPLITDLSRELLRMSNLCQNHFPYQGGYFDQLNIYIQALSIINSEMNRISESKIKRLSKSDG